jgi:hypothetical protein
MIMHPKFYSGAPKGLMEDTKYGMNMEGTPQGEKRSREVLG